MLSEFRVPWGVTPDGELVSRTEALKGESYTCPACGVRLSLHAGQIVARHFAHVSRAPCANETDIHLTAKNLIAATVNNWRTKDGRRPSISRPCKRCHGLIHQPLPDRVTSAQTEYRISGGLVADVALFARDGLAAIVEVFVSHAVDADKGLRLEGVPWIEVDGEHIVSDPFHWHPSQSGGLKPVDRVCDTCLRTIADHAARCEAIAKGWHILLPGRPYRVMASACYECKSDLLIFDWAGGMWAQPRPPHPIPRTVQFRESLDYGGHYWANTCPHCKRVQGDFYVRHLFDDLDALVLDLRGRAVPPVTAVPRQLTMQLREGRH